LAGTIGIVGGGAMGTLLMTRLSAAGTDVRAVVRNGARIERLHRDLPRVKLVPDAAGLAPASLVFLCIKAYDTAAAAEALGAVDLSRAAVCSLQNGWGNLDVLEAALPRTALLAGATTLGAYLDDSGTLHASPAGLTRIAPWDATPAARAEDAAGVLRAAGLAVEVSDDARGLLWRKLTLNAAVNPLTAIAQCPNGALLREPGLLRLTERAALEAALVGERLGCLAGPWDPLPALRALLLETEANRSSMAQDLSRRRRTEVDAIAGAVVRAADDLGTPAPLLKALLVLVRAAESPTDRP
jgi:2-dehydropantoate 2-reductase